MNLPNPFHVRNDEANLARAFFLPSSLLQKLALLCRGWRPVQNRTHWHKPSKRCRELMGS